MAKRAPARQAARKARAKPRPPETRAPGSRTSDGPASDRGAQDDAAELRGPDRGSWNPKDGRLGICLSGGGIRSASYCLGALQALQDRNELERAEYLASVSGGSYIAGAYMLCSRHSDPELLKKLPPFAPGSPEEEHLRNRSSYIAPGLYGKTRAVGTLILGASANFFIAFVLLFIVARPLGWFTAAFHPYLRCRIPACESQLVLTTWNWMVPAGLGVAALIIGYLAVFKRPKERTRKIFAIASALTVGAAAATFLLLLALPASVWFQRFGLPIALERLWDIVPGTSGGKAEEATGFLHALQVSGAFTFVFGLVRTLLGKHPGWGLKLAAWVTPWLLLGVTMADLVNDAAAAGWRGDLFLFERSVGPELAWVGGALVLVALAALALDVTNVSLHPFYKRRLCSAFCVHRVEAGQRAKTKRDKELGIAQELDFDQYWMLSDLAPEFHPGGRKVPELILGAAVNVMDANITPPGRDAGSFTYSPTEIGGPLVCYVDTKVYEHALVKRRVKDVTAPAAIAVSGAAISPAMGKFRIGPVRWLLTLANLRLGLWIPSPRVVAENPLAKPIGSPIRLWRLFFELVGYHRVGHKWLYVSDGGHWENLGLVELLRRGCTSIYCFDASGDQIDTAYTLGEAIALARTELGVEFKFDADPILGPTPEETEEEKKDKSKGKPKVSPDAASPPVEERDHVAGTFKYPGKNGPEGVIVVARPRVLKDAPWDVRAYAQKHASFPTDSTLEQLFTDSKFEAYRALGFHTAARAILTMQDEEEKRTARGEASGAELEMLQEAELPTPVEQAARAVVNEALE